jgi:hypothetical protein
MRATNLLAQLTAADVVMDPYPHVVVRDALPEEECAGLIRDWPGDEVIQGGEVGKSNRRYNLRAAQALGSGKVSARWEEFLREHTGAAFGEHLLRVFGPAIGEYAGEFKRRLKGDLGGCRFGLRDRDGIESSDLLLDAQIANNSPVVREATSVRAAHVDLTEKLFIGLYYLRSPEDVDSRGGELLLCRPRVGMKPRMYEREVDAASVDVARRVAYGRNVLVLFLNGPLSIHAVTRREPTPHARRFVNLIGQAAEPLFGVDAYQIPRWRYLSGLLRDRYVSKSEFGFGSQRL